MLWAPLSEIFGRQILFFITYFGLTAFNAGVCGSQNIWTVIILRFFAGSFGSSPLTNAGGVIADVFPAAQRGLAMSLFAAAPFLGPVMGPIAGNFLGMTSGWRWVMGLLAIFSAVVWIAGSLIVPETYAPVLLRRRAEKLSKITGKVYVSKLEMDQGKKTLGETLKICMSRPWILLFMEPIVLFLSIYLAIVYGTLYMLFEGFPIVFQEVRHWNQGVGSLPFLSIMVGMMIAVAYSVVDNKRYVKLDAKYKGFAPPEARLPPSMVASAALPIGLFWFAWTNYTHIHWIVCIIATAPFGFGMVLCFLTIFNYLIDAYTIFAASVLAANSVLRSLFGAAFPLFTTYMYHNIGIHWASSIPGFLAVACVPFPFLFYKYGFAIRTRCKYSAQSEQFMRKLQQQSEQQPPESEAEDKGEEEDSEKDEEAGLDRTEAPAPRESDSSSSEPNQDQNLERRRSRTQSIASARTASTLRRKVTYEENPFDIDRVNTLESFKSRK